jgi:hypothetical protein
MLVFLASGDVLAGGDLFTDAGVLKVELRGPVAATLRDTKDPGERQFAIVTDDGERSVMVRTRGKSRLEVCEFPPLRLNFREEKTPDDNLFAGLDKVKLVSHCGNSSRNHDDLLAEYAAYRMFQALTDNSYRVRLMRMRYVETERRKRKTVEGPAFLIEPSDRAAARLSGDASPVQHIVKSRIDRDQAALVFVFQYLIGNSDYSLVTATADDECCHNLDPLTINDRHVFVPYDFDLSSLVGARYARQSASYMRNRGKERVYGGYCLDDLPLEHAIETVLAHRQEFLDLVRELPWSSDESMQKRIDFVGSFFEEAVEDGFAGRLDEGCLGRR